MAIRENHVAISGHLGRDLEIKQINLNNQPSEIMVTSLAVQRSSSKDAKPDWFNLKIWGAPLVEYLKKNPLIKGDEVYVVGRLQNRVLPSEDSTQQPRTITEISVTKIALVKRKNRENEDTSNEDDSLDLPF